MENHVCAPVPQHRKVLADGRERHAQDLGVVVLEAVDVERVEAEAEQKRLGNDYVSSSG